jgi:hypothetical protein
MKSATFSPVEYARHSQSILQRSAMSLLAAVRRSVLLWLLSALCVNVVQAQSTAANIDSSSINITYFHKFYAGKIADKYAFTMDLKNLNGKLSGTYRYVGRQSDVYLTGKVDPSGSFTMNEQDGSGKRTGTFTGQIHGKQIDGAWQSANGAREFHFDANQTSEIVIGSKKEIMTRAIGDYPLDSISGSGGANGMWDTWKTKGKWQSNESSIVAARREASMIALTPADTRLLDSLAITVDPNLTTRFIVKGKTLLTIPYQDSGMQFSLEQEHNSVVEDELKPFSPKTTVEDEQLYLLVKDGVDYSKEISGNFDAAVSDIITVSYSVVSGTFDVTFTEGQCCGVTIFTFSRRKHS